MKTLVIIGNGFDLAHNLPTSFNDFMKNSPINKQEEYNVFANKDNDWNEIENKYKTLLQEEVEKRDFLSILDETMQVASKYDVNKYDEIDCYGYKNETFNRNIEHILNLNNLLISFEKDFLVYLKDKCSEERLADITAFNKVTKILKSATDIITFNYTKTIECGYKIKDVKHIHGSINDSIVIGVGAIEELKESMIDGEYATRNMFEPTKQGFQEYLVYYEEDMDGNLVESYRIRKVFDKVKLSAEESEQELFELIDTKNKDKLEERIKIIEYLKNSIFDKVYIIGHSLNDEDASVLEIIKAKEIICYYHEKSNRNEYQLMKDRSEKLQLNCKLISDKEIFV